jgi:hypothetical protein
MLGGRKAEAYENPELERLRVLRVIIHAPLISGRHFGGSIEAEEHGRFIQPASC